MKVEGAAFLNDLATAPDGTVYASDSQSTRIYAVKDGKSSVFVAGAEVVEQPNGLLVDGGAPDSRHDRPGRRRRRTRRRRAVRAGRRRRPGSSTRSI